VAERQFWRERGCVRAPLALNRHRARSIGSRRLSARAIKPTTRNVANNLAVQAVTGISVGQAFQPDTLKSQAGKPALLPDFPIIQPTPNTNDSIDLWPIQFSDYATDTRKLNVRNDLCQ
jgi:hypothetical protein